MASQLKDYKREMQILKYQLANNGNRPPTGYLEENEDSPSMTSIGGGPGSGNLRQTKSKFDKNSSPASKISGAVNTGASAGAYNAGSRNGTTRTAAGKAMSRNPVISSGPVEEFEIEEEVMVDGKLTKVKKTVYRQKKKVAVMNEKGEIVEVEQYEDIDEEDVIRGEDGKLTNANSGVKVSASGKKMIKIVKKDKNGQDVVEWQEIPDGVDFDDPENADSEQVVMADGKVYKKIFKKDKNGKDVVQWVDAEELEAEENEVQEIIAGGTIKKTKGGKTLAKVITKDQNGNDVEEWVEMPEGLDMSVTGKGPTRVTAANGKVLQKIITKDENGEDVVQWVETPESAAAGNSKVPGTPQRANSKKVLKKGSSISKKEANGMMTLQEEVEEEVTVIDENGNAVKVIKKVMKTKQVKKVIDENGEEVIEEEVIDPVTGVKNVIRRKVKDLKNAKLTTDADNDMDDGESVYSAGGTKRNVKHKEVQTSFSLEDMIKAALENAGIKGSALAQINKALSKAGIDILKPKQTEEGDQDEYVTAPGQGRKKVIYKQGEDTEEVEFVTKDGRVIKKKVPKGAQDEYEVNEDGELVQKASKDKSKIKGKPSRNKLLTEASQESGDEHNESMISVYSEDENGNVVKKKKKKAKFNPLGPGEHEVRKATLDEYIRMEEELEKNGPPLNKEEAQTRAMYKAMLTKAKQDPKLMNLFKNFMREKGVNVDDENFIVDFDNFKDYLKKFKETHGKCGDKCTHLQRFFARIGYYPMWNNRVPLEMKRPDIATDKTKNSSISLNTSPTGNTTKLPIINPKKLGSPKV